MIGSEWSHHNPVSLRLGRGCRAEILPVLRSQRAWFVTSPRGRQQIENDPILGSGIENARYYWLDCIRATPCINDLQALLDANRAMTPEIIIAVGGGSVIDSAKVLALALAPCGRGHSLRHLIELAPNLKGQSGIPVYALPTTSGTGSEATPYATLWDHVAKKKLSFSGDALYPRAALVDPLLTDNAPQDVTLFSGLDAINQAAESIWNHRMTPVSEAFAQRALALGLPSLSHLIAHPNDHSARDAMAQASLLAGLAISQTRTALCHSISYPLTAHYGVPHGLACAFTMPAVLRHNLAGDDGRFQRLASHLAPGGSDAYSSLLHCFDTLHARLGIAERVRAMVGSFEALIALESEMFTPERVDNVLRPVDNRAVRRILEQAWAGSCPPIPCP